MKSEKLDPPILFHNDHFVLAFSVLTATVLWFTMTTINTQERPCIVYDVPVTVKLSETSQGQELEVFEQSVKTAKMSIRGNNIVVNRIKPKNIQTMATSVSSITQPGSYPLPLMTQEIDSLADYEIVSIESSTIITNVDVYKKVTFPTWGDVIYKADPDYFVSAPSFSLDIVAISGPERETAEIKKVSAGYDVKEALTQSKSFTTGLMLYDAYGEKLSTDKLNTSIKSVSVDIMVLARKVMKLGPIFTDKPVGLALSSAVQEINPETVEMARSESVLANVNEPSLETIDFSKFSIGNQNLQVDITFSSDCKGLSSIYTTSVTLDLSGFKSRKINTTDFRIKGLTAGKSAQVFTRSLAMVLIGPTKQIDAITTVDVYAQVDVVGRESFTGYPKLLTAPVAKGHTSAWAYEECKADASAMKKDG